MTIIKCQPLLYELLFPGSLASCAAPASRVAVQASTPLNLLRVKSASAGLARFRRGNVRHDLTSGYFRALSSCHVIIDSCRNKAHGNKAPSVQETNEAERTVVLAAADDSSKAGHKDLSCRLSR